MNKAHGHDDIFIRMIKTCDSMVTEPQFFKKTVLNAEPWMQNISRYLKKVVYCTVHKNNDKHL